MEDPASAGDMLYHDQLSIIMSTDSHFTVRPEPPSNWSQHKNQWYSGVCQPEQKAVNKHVVTSLANWGHI